MHTIRPFQPTDAEYEAVVAVANAAWPDEQDTVANWKHNDNNRSKERLFQRFVVEDVNQQIVAEASCRESSWSHVPGKYLFDITVHPDWQWKGVEAQCYDHILTFLSKRDLKPTCLEVYVREDKTAWVKFVEDHGYQMMMREASSKLDLLDYDFSPFEAKLSKVSQQEIDLLSLPEVQQRDSDWLQHYYNLAIAILNDVPTTDDITPEPIAEFAKGFKHPNFLPKAHFIALDGEGWVGLSTLWKDAVQVDRLWVGLTGVLPRQRRRGIATALKWLTFDYARQNNVRYITTDNEENNPMYDLNVALGFTPLPAWLCYRKELS